MKVFLSAFYEQGKLLVDWEWNFCGFQLSNLIPPLRYQNLSELGLVLSESEVNYSVNSVVQVSLCYKESLSFHLTEREQLCTG